MLIVFAKVLKHLHFAPKCSNFANVDFEEHYCCSLAVAQSGEIAWHGRWFFKM